ncbi:tetratricopeptide repeat protein [Streptomyces sp. NBC_01498]|uniref:tetratricopeptide repeat protein n=1 Tax=Streptomyces sp. NBC_01498 TaxID=2975870 RepID=UPI002E7BB315|nr:tetratricopeptide repeat protein [Streptomyces sp. NBC_01498]WTL27655.1 tetratricopeptide repeat protein [Streptomyces sp. NBC_01498]
MFFSVAAPPEAPALEELANLALQMSLGIVTVVTLIIGVVAFFGVREVKDLRRLSGRIRQDLEESEKTRMALERRLVSFESDFESVVLAAHLFHEGENAYRTADYDQSISYHEQALTLQPENSKIHVRLARALINKGLNSRAERSLRIALRKDEENADAWRALATVKRYVDVDEAVRLMEKALEYDGSSVDNWNYLGLLLRDAGQFEESLNSHEQASRLSPRNGITCFYRALIMLRLGRVDSANHEFYQAHLHSEESQRANGIKPIWAMTIQWSYLYSLDDRVREEEAIRLAGTLADLCQERRNSLVVIGHMLFYLRSRSIDYRSDASIQKFPPADVTQVAHAR